MDRRRFLAALGFGAVAPAMVDPLMDRLTKDGLVVEPHDLMEPVEKQEPLPDSKIIEIYKQTLQDMGVHNEAIDRMTGKWEELHVRQAKIAAAKARHAENIRIAQKKSKGRRAEQRKRDIRRRLRESKRTPKPKLP